LRVCKVIVSVDIPKEVLVELQTYCEVLPFSTSQVTYAAISNHPDIFMCQFADGFIVAPNTPNEFRNNLVNNDVVIIDGDADIGTKYPKTAIYNAVITDNFLIHNLKFTDKKILETCINKKTIHVNQAYTRCNLLPLKDDSFITSDKGICDTLVANRLNVLYVNSHDILLPGFDYGFFGGACGVYNNQVFIAGSLDNITDGRRIKEFLINLDYEIIELYEGQLFDCGSLFFV